MCVWVGVVCASESVLQGLGGLRVSEQSSSLWQTLPLSNYSARAGSALTHNL